MLTKLTLQGIIKTSESVTSENLPILIDDLSNSINTSWDALDKSDLINDEDIIEKIDYIEIFASIEEVPIYTIIVWLTEEINANEQEIIKYQLEFEVGYGLNEYIQEQFGESIKLESILEIKED